jgi:hypothetical protein
MTTDFRALCAELHAAFTTYAVDECHHNLLERARAALAEPEPEGPTDEDLWNTADLIFQANCWPTDAIRYARAVLARWGNHQEILDSSTPQPIPVSERLPGPEGPTDDELDNMANEAGLDLAWRPELRRFARFILASGAAAILQPIPVSKELPWELDCDAEGRCWWGRSESNDRFADWTLATHEAVAEFCEFSPQTVWLPAHALPLPTAND